MKGSAPRILQELALRNASHRRARALHPRKNYGTHGQSISIKKRVD